MFKNNIFWDFSFQPILKTFSIKLDVNTINIVIYLLTCLQENKLFVLQQTIKNKLIMVSLVYIRMPRVDSRIGDLIIFIDIVRIVVGIVNTRTIRRVAHDARVMLARMHATTATLGIIRSEVLMRRRLAHSLL